MTRIEIRTWDRLPVPPCTDIHHCGLLQVAPEGSAFLYINAETELHHGGYCTNPERLASYASDALAQFVTEGPSTAWDRLPDGTYITALMDEVEADESGVRAMKAPPQERNAP